MANAMVESVKTFGFRHGEKVVAGLLSVLCLLLVVKAISKQTIDMTPDQIQKAAESAQNNLNQKQAKEEILAKFDQDGLIPPGFTKKVVELAAGKQSERKYAFTGPPFIYTEPGAGLIRETPELIAPEELYASSNRGSIQVFARDKDGNLVYEEAKKEAAKSTRSRRRPRRNPMAMASSSSSGGSGMASMARAGTPKKTSAEEKKEQEAEAQRKKELFVGKAGAEDAEIAAKAEQGQKPKETSKGVRPVAIVGVIDHQKLKDNYISALKDTNAQPHYLRLDVQRQDYRGETWSDWADVNQTANDEIKDNETEIEEELAPETVRLEGLVDSLPFFKVGYYRGVHVAEFVPKEKRVTAPPPSAAQGGSEYGSSSSSSESSMIMSGPNSGSAGSSSEMSSSMITSSMVGSGSGMMGGAAGPPEDTNFPKTTAARIMVRMLDFTSQPDTTYRYRLRIVVRNPNLRWENVAPGTDTTSQEAHRSLERADRAGARPRRRRHLRRAQGPRREAQ